MGRLIDHCQQFRGCRFNFVIAEFPRPAFDRKQTTAMNILKITERESVSRLAIRRVALIDSKVPLGIFRKTVIANKVVLLGSLRMIVFPSALFVGNETALIDERGRPIKGFKVNSYRRILTWAAFD